MTDQPFRQRRLLVVGLCALVVFMDGFDTQAIGYVAPAIVQDFKVDRAALAPVFAAGLFGLMLGALAFGPIADRVGRKPVLVFLCGINRRPRRRSGRASGGTPGRLSRAHQG